MYACHGKDPNPASSPPTILLWATSDAALGADAAAGVVLHGPEVERRAVLVVLDVVGISISVS